MSQQSLDINNAALATTYNDVPYTSYVFAHCQPTRLHALAKMKGLDPAPVETARVLEIGCSYGGNLVPFAIRYPESLSVGIDLSEQQIKVGQEMIQQIGLNNVELVSADISTVSFNIKFDYIICHGVFSWVPGFVQDAILSVIQQYLSPNGVAFISYNAYPGWKTKEISKDFMLFNSNPKSEKVVQIDQAFELMNFTNDILKNKNNSICKINSETFEHILSAQKSYIAHEYFELYNNPFYLKDFINKAEQYNLSYVTDSSTPTIFSFSVFKDDQKFQELANYYHRNFEYIEQYFDFILNRQFRCSVIAHKDNLNKRGINKNLEQYYLCHYFYDLYIYVDNFYKNENEEGVASWHLPSRSISFNANEMNNALFNYLKEINDVCKVSDIFEALRNHPAYNEEDLKNTIWTIIHLHNIYISFKEEKTASYGRKPKISDLYRNWILFVMNNPGITALANRYNNTITFSPLIQYLVPYLDGTKGIKDLVSIVREAFEKDILSISEDGEKVSIDTISDAKLKNHIKSELDVLAMNGFFN